MPNGLLMLDTSVRVFHEQRFTILLPIVAVSNSLFFNFFSS